MPKLFRVEMSKATKRRFCPALQKEITAQNCGENRNSKYSCPADCSFNLFAPANYTQLLEVENRLDEISFDELISESGRGEEVRRRLEKIGFDNYNFCAAVFFEQFFRKDDRAQSFAERWQEAGFPGLKNDLRCIFRAKMGMRLGLTEVQCVLDSETIQLKDLIDPARPPFTVLDRSLAARASRFEVYLGHYFEMPHFTRFTGKAVIVPEMGVKEPDEIVRQIVAHLGGSTESSALRLWLAENFALFSESLGATSEARREKAFEAANLKTGKALYQLLAPYAECRAALDAVAEVAPDKLGSSQADEGFSDVRVWFASEADRRRKGSLGREALGIILLGQTFWRLEAYAEDRLGRLQALFEAALGSKVRLDAVRMDDLHRKILVPGAPLSPLAVPSLLTELPRFSINLSRVSPMEHSGVEPLPDVMQRTDDKAFLDTPVPVLDGATPRAAAQNPDLLPRLRRLLKQRVCGTDRLNLESGGTYDPCWLMAELGQPDLCVPPPPRGRMTIAAPHPLKPGASADGDRPVAPALPLHISTELALERIESTIASFPKLSDAASEARAGGCTWIEDACELLDFPETSETLSALGTALLQAWFVMVPIGFRAPEVPIEGIVERFDRYLDEMRASITDAELKNALTAEFQSPLGQMTGLNFMDMRAELNGKPLDDDDLAPIMVLILALIDELHATLSEPATR